MKRSLVSSIIFSILIFAACTPQQVTGTLEVTVTLPSPTETPTPLPTPSPESLLPQTVKEKFETAGIDLKDMQNAKYDKNGLSITLESGEVVLLTNEELEKNIFLGQDNVLQYRDESNQNVIYAYDKESGKWGVAELTPEQQLDLDLNRWGITPENYNVDYDKEGKIELREKGTNKLVYWDGRWSSDVIVKMVIATNDCQETKFLPASPTANWTTEELQKEFRKYIGLMDMQSRALPSYKKFKREDPSSSIAVPFAKTNNWWGQFMLLPSNERVLFIWTKASGEVELAGVFEPELHK